MKRTVLVFGLIAGAIISLMMMLTMPFIEEIGDAGEIVGYTSMVLAFLLIWFGIRSYRENVAGGTVSFGRAFKVGALITVVASLCYVATWEVIYFNFMPDFADKYSARILEKERAAGATAEQLEVKQAELQKFKKMYDNPLFNAGFTFLEPLPVGLIVSLVAAAAMRKRTTKEAT